MGPIDRFYSCKYLMMLMIGTCGSWVELLIQGRLYPIFVNRVGLPDLHEYFAG